MTHVPALPVRQGLVYLSVAAVAWGTGGAAGALLQHNGDLSPAAVSFWRFACGAALLLAAGRLAGRAVPRPRWRTVLVMGPALAVCQAAYFAAIAETGVAVATMVTMGASPVFVALGGRVCLREPLSRTRLACVGLAVAGLIMLAGGAAGAWGAGGLGSNPWSPQPSASSCWVSALRRSRRGAGSRSWPPSPGSDGQSSAGQPDDVPRHRRKQDAQEIRLGIGVRTGSTRAGSSAVLRA